MSAKLCPMNVISRAICPDGGFPIECGEDSCAWWHEGMCDVSRIATDRHLDIRYMTSATTDAMHRPYTNLEVKTMPTNEEVDA
jgi:hypothetical protein